MLITEKDKTGKFGRILGKFLVYDGKTDSQIHLGEIMIREYHAVPYLGQSKEEVKNLHFSNRKFVLLEG